MKNIAIFASGNGSNAQNIIEYFAGNKNVKVVAVFSNSKNAFVLERAKKFRIPSVVFNKEDFYHNDNVVNKLKSFNTDFIVLAGFLWLIPDRLIKLFPRKIVNIHPALLPRYGGKGMYGMKVHKAVKNAGETETGITIHYVDEHYDEGEIIFQARVKIEETDSPEDIAGKIHQLEYEFFPKTIERLF